jgi:hypothetical protein
VNEELAKLTPAARARLAALDVAAFESEDRAKAANARLQQPFGALRDESARALLQDIEADSRRRHLVLIQLCNKAREWLRQLDAGLILEDVEPLEAEVSGDDLTKEIVSTRLQIAELKSERTKVANAPLPKQDQVDFVRDYVVELRKRGAPEVRVRDGRLEAFFVDQRKDFGVTESFVASMLAWCAPNAFEKRLTEAIERQPDVFALSANDKIKRLAVLEAELDSAERREESLIQAAVKAGQDMPRRAEASPAAILAVRAVPRPVVIALPVASVASDNDDAVSDAMSRAEDESTRAAIKLGKGTILTLESGKLWKFRNKGPMTPEQRKAVSEYYSQMGKRGAQVSMKNWHDKLAKDAELERRRAPFRLDKVENNG